MKNLLLLTPFLFFFASCSKDTEAVKTAFAQIIIQEEWNGEKAEKHFSQNSLNYLKEIAKISDTTNYQIAQVLGYEYSRELVTMKMHGEMSSYKQVFSSPGENLTIDDILFMMQFNGTGIIGMNAQKMLQFKNVANVTSDRAEVQVLVATGDKKATIVSTYIFKQENEIWKLDLLSTLSLEEKLLKQTLRRSPFRNDKAKFIANHLSSPPQEMQFQYRVRN